MPKFKNLIVVSILIASVFSAFNSYSAEGAFGGSPCDFWDKLSAEAKDPEVLTYWIMSSTSIFLPTTTTVEAIRCFFEKKFAYLRIQQQRFATIANDNLVRDMASGGGEYIDAMSYLHGCPSDVHDRYIKVAKKNFPKILTHPELDPKILLSNLGKQIGMDPLLAKECAWIL